MVNMRSPGEARSTDDRTARARIRDEALRLFAERGADGVPLRDVASAANVSAALVVKHYGSKDGLRDAVDEHVAALFEAMLAEVALSPRPDPAGLGSLAEAVAGHLPPGSAVTDYLGRMLVDGGPAGAALFRRLYDVAVATLDAMVAAGLAEPGTDPRVRAAVLLTNDLGALILRRHVADVLGLDPLSPDGTARWGAEILTIYATGLGGRATESRPDGPEDRR